MYHVIPTIHPAAVLPGRDAQAISDAIAADVRKAWRVSQQGHSQVENHVIAHPANPSGLEAAVREARAWIARWRALQCPTAIDVESSSLYYWRCKLHSIGASGCDGYFTGVAFTLMDYRTLPPEAERILTSDLHGLLADPYVEKVFHNAPYDMAVLRRKGFNVIGPITDTLSLHHLIQPDCPHDLGWVGHEFLDVEPWKLNHEGKKKAFTTDPIELLIYNNKDAINTAKLRAPLLAEIFARGMNQRLISYQMGFAWLATQMELAGLPINKAKWKAQGDAMLSRCQQLRHELRQALDWADFNPDSHVHVQRALYDQKYLGLRPTGFTETGQPATDYDHLVTYVQQHPVVAKVVEYVEKRSAWGNRYATAEQMAALEKLKDGKDHQPKWSDNCGYVMAFESDGRMHIRWKPAEKMKGSRFGSEPNGQNVPEAERAMFEPPPGRAIVGADKDQLELRVAVCLAGAEEMLHVVRDPGVDPHRYVAERIFGDEFRRQDAAGQKKVRNGTKNVEYASLYRAKQKVVHNTIMVNKRIPLEVRMSTSYEMVCRIYNGLFDSRAGLFAPIERYHDKNYALSRTQRYLEIPPFGRRRYFPQPVPPFTECANWPIQCCGSDIVGMEILHIQLDLLDKYKGTASVILHAHDAVYVECNEGDAPAVAKLINHHFGRSVLEGPAGPVYLTASANIGRNLLEAK